MTNRDKNEPKRADIYEEFVLWSAMPPSERFKFGIETQEQFVEFYKIGINTPTAWKRRPEFEPRVTALRREWAFGRTGAVIEGIYRSALKGNPHSQKLWLQYFHNFSEKQEVTVTAQRMISIDDTLALIAALPKEKQEKHFAWIREFLHDASMAHQKAHAEGGEADALWHNPIPADWKPRYRLVDTEKVEEDEDVVETLKIPVAVPRRYATQCDQSVTYQKATSGSCAAGLASLPSSITQSREILC